MAKKITNLPSASQPTGNEMLPVVQGGENLRTSVGIAKVMPGFGALPTNYSIGALAYIVDAVGGAQPAYFDGTQWKQFKVARPPVNTMGNGIWVVGVGLSSGIAHLMSTDTGYYFTSEDGFIWRRSKIFFMDQGFENISYANGCFLAGGHYSIGLGGGIGGMESTSIDPRNQTTWHLTLPYGHQEAQGTTPGLPTAYDDILGTFTVPIFPSLGTQLIQNELPSAVTPDPDWPWLGQNSDGISVLGVGTAGPVEVKIFTKDITITPFATDFYFKDGLLIVDINTGNPIPLTPAGAAGVYTSMFMQARKFGTSDWVPALLDTSTLPPSQQTEAFFEMLAGNSINSAGLSLRGLVWGPVKQCAVRCAPGAT